MQACIPATLRVTKEKAFMVEVIQKELRGRQQDLKCEQMQLQRSYSQTVPQRRPVLRQPVTALLASAAHLVRVRAAISMLGVCSLASAVMPCDRPCILHHTSYMQNKSSSKTKPKPVLDE